ncbi:hypothetical protein BLA29_005704 [Euroglyphus maynei]|uniref:Uncharacterized protein n=1 Tax=Euroglyphus maynei TaxID=6958 RepID=A0A1Y3AY43_EURMA|nr:hypothetical protein BLA29_005704 [Euroglyphus maynei]
MFVFGVISIFITLNTALWLFIDAQLRTIYFRDCFLQLNLLMKDLTNDIHSSPQRCHISDNSGSKWERRLIYFICRHNFLCWYLQSMNPWWRRRNMLCVAITIPNNAMMVNLLLFQKFDSRRFFVLCTLTVLQFVLAAIVMGIIPAIHYYAVGSRQSMYAYLALLPQATKSNSIRTKIKSLAYLERITCKQRIIGTQIGDEQHVITVMSLYS